MSRNCRAVIVYDYRTARTNVLAEFPRSLFDQKALCAQLGKQPDNHQVIVVDTLVPVYINNQYLPRLVLYFSDSYCYIGDTVIEGKY